MFSRRTSWNLTRNRYTEALEDYTRGGREVLDLTASNPTTIGLIYSAGRLLDSLSRPGALTYQPAPKGSLSAREAVAAYYADKGIFVPAEDLILTTSTSEAYSYVFRLLCDPGDAVFVPAPSYPLFDFLADLNDVRLVSYPLVYDHGWQIDFPSLHAAMQRTQGSGAPGRALLVVHPNNPTGSYVRAHEAAELSRVCAQNQMAIVADEVFLDYCLGQQPPMTFANGAETLTFTLSGLSKISGLPQMKLAWVSINGPESLKQEAIAKLEVIADTFLSVSAAAQLALPEMLAERHNIQPQLLQRIKTNLAALDTELGAQSLCHRLEFQGGWYAILRVPALGSDEDLAIDLLRENGVLVQPGHFFNFPGDGYLVASLITPSKTFAEGVGRALRYIAAR